MKLESDIRVCDSQIIKQKVVISIKENY